MHFIVTPLNFSNIQYLFKYYCLIYIDIVDFTILRHQREKRDDKKSNHEEFQSKSYFGNGDLKKEKEDKIGPTIIVNNFTWNASCSLGTRKERMLREPKRSKLLRRRRI